MSRRALTYFLAPQAGGIGLVRFRKPNRVGRIPRDETPGRHGNSKRERRRLGEL
jgi:hypothetical protein